MIKISFMEPTFETDLNKVKDLVVDLVVKRGFPHKQLKKEIHSAIMDAVNDLPKISVLYSPVYGGYGYSKQFEDFLQNVPDDDDDSVSYVNSRKEHVPLVIQFGEKCKSDLSLVSRMISTYNKLLLVTSFRHVERIKDKLKKTQKIQDTINSLEYTDPSLFGKNTDVICINFYYFELDKVLKYDLSALLDYCNKELSKNEDEITKEKRILNEKIDDQNLYDALVIASTPKEDISKPWWQANKWNEKLVPDKGLTKLTFLDGIEEYGEDHFAVWECQQHYNKDAMQFLLSNKEFISEDNSECTPTEIGLLCASGPYCKLAIREIPPIVDWYIGEYDGKESVCIKA